MILTNTTQNLITTYNCQNCKFCKMGRIHEYCALTYMSGESTLRIAKHTGIISDPVVISCEHYEPIEVVR